MTNKNIKGHEHNKSEKQYVAGCFSPIDIDYNTEPKRWVDVIPQEAWLFSKSYHKDKK